MNITASWWEISSPLASLLHSAANVGAAQLQWTAGQQQSPMLPSAHPNQPQPMLPCKHKMDPCMCLPVLYSWWIFPAEIQKDALRYCPRGANQKLNPCSEGDICDTCSEYRMIVTTHIKPNFSVSAPSKQNYPLLPHPCSKCSGFRGHTSCTGMEQWAGAMGHVLSHTPTLRQHAWDYWERGKGMGTVTIAWQNCTLG